jgi:glutathione synthase/RimK-type ligase-like ATP-grasp enzyme
MRCHIRLIFVQESNLQLMKIAIVSYQSSQKNESSSIMKEDDLLISFLKEKQLDAESVIWNDPGVEWKQYDVAILKTPWDYHYHIDVFFMWLDMINILGIQLLNPVELVKWNSDKHYLKAIEMAGFPVIASVFLEQGTLPDLVPLFEQFKTQKLILKPCISGGAKNTIILAVEDVYIQLAVVHQLLKDGDYIVQPFMEEIFEGEWSYMFFNGVFSHAVLKVPKKGDFRVQGAHGGSSSGQQPEQSHVKSAQILVNEFAKGALYARVDGIISNGELQLMELELIEPYLFLDTHPDGFLNYYNALMQLLKMSDKVA